MASKFSQVSYGSSGDDVKTLQEMLNGNGYSLDVDGVFGAKTQAAVKDYQKNKGLSVDGIVGTNTWGALTGYKPGDKLNASTTASGAATQNMGTIGAPAGTAMQAKPAAVDMQFSYDPYEESDAVKQANALLAQFQTNKPGDFSYGKQGQLDAIMQQYLNREDFSYDLNADALYQQYKDQYMTQGKLAMMDTMGQAQAMTGGYGNSYAQAVGQQAYQGYLQQLNDMVPELYGMALDRYNMEGEKLLNQYGLLNSEKEQEYGVYRDKVSDYYTELQRLTEDARYLSEAEYNKYLNDLNMKYGIFSDEKSYAYQAERDAVEDKRYEESFDYQKEQDAIDNQHWEQSFQYQKDRDSVADQQWAQEFAEAQRQYNESKNASSGGSSGSTKQYEMSASEFEKWNNLWAGVETEADAEAMAEGMAAAGVPDELIFTFYGKYMGDYEKDEEKTDTTVTANNDKPKRGSSTGGSSIGGSSRFQYNYVRD